MNLIDLSHRSLLMSRSRQEGIPFFVWYIDFQFKHKAFVKVFVKNAEAVKAGVEPVPPPSLWKRIFGM